MTKQFFKNCLVALLITSPVSLVNAQTSSGNTSQKVMALVNKERRARGLRSLAGSAKIAQVAYRHAKDMNNKNYFSHVSLDGRTVGQRFKQGGVSYRVAGENIAKGQKTEQRVMAAWMNSPGHRKNILNPKYGKIGVARVGNIWVQNFSD